MNLRCVGFISSVDCLFHVTNQRAFRLLGLALIALFAVSSAAAAQPLRGFATYQVSVTTPKGVHSALVNESVGPSDKSGYSNLVLQIVGGVQSFTYTRLVNSSENYFPFLSNLATQSFDYSNGTTSGVHLSVTQSGTTPLTFNGAQYTLDVYTISASASYGTRSSKVNGTVETFPSTLVYSAEAGNKTVNVQAVLKATDLQLNGPSPVSTVAYVGAGVSVGALALGGVFLIRRREKKAESKDTKPMHWVD